MRCLYYSQPLPFAPHCDIRGRSEQQNNDPFNYTRFARKQSLHSYNRFAFIITNIGVTLTTIHL